MSLSSFKMHFCVDGLCLEPEGWPNLGARVADCCTGAFKMKGSNGRVNKSNSGGKNVRNENRDGQSRVGYQVFSKNNDNNANFKGPIRSA